MSRHDPVVIVGDPARREPVVIFPDDGRPLRSPQRTQSLLITSLTIGCLLIAFYDLLLLAINI